MMEWFEQVLIPPRERVTLPHSQMTIDDDLSRQPDEGLHAQ